MRPTPLAWFEHAATLLQVTPSTATWRPRNPHVPRAVGPGGVTPSRRCDWGTWMVGGLAHVSPSGGTGMCGYPSEAGVEKRLKMKEESENAR